MVDRIRNTSVFSCALISEINLTVSINSNVFKQSVTFDSSVDIGFAFFIQVDNLSVATTFVVKYTFVIPSVFVVTDQQEEKLETVMNSLKAGLSLELIAQITNLSIDEVKKISKQVNK